MSLSYPLTLPTEIARHLRFKLPAVVGSSQSPFTLAQQVYDWAAGKLMIDVDLPPLSRAEAAVVFGFLVAMRGRVGSTLAGDPINTSPRGTWAGTPKVLGAHAVRATSIAMDGFSAAATVLAGDWFQQGTSSSSRLHMAVQNATADGSGLLTIECFPPLRAALADNDTFVTSSPKGLFMLSSMAEWSIERAQMYGLQFSLEEDLRDI